jgi:hypothetical protein
VSQTTQSERRLAAQIRSHVSWANTPDRTKRTSPARAAFEQRFLDQAGGDPVRAASLRKAYYAKLAQASARARKARKTAQGGDGNAAA